MLLKKNFGINFPPWISFFYFCRRLCLQIGVQQSQYRLKTFYARCFRYLRLDSARNKRFLNEKIFKKIKMAHIALVLLTIMLISTIISFPHYLSYYNILAGGTDNGYKIATDSNYDWGQDIKRLGKMGPR